MRDDKKAIAAMIVSKAKKPEEVDMNPYPDEMPEDEEAEMGLDVAADDLMAAFEAKDPSMIKAALKSFVEMCK